MNNFKNQKGFTLIEILVVIGMIALLATIVLIAINPARQFAQGRDTQRTSNLNTILNAIGQKTADCKGLFSDATCGTACPALPGPNLTDAKTIDNAAGGPGADINLSCLAPIYVSALPVDPSSPTAPSTGYQVYQDGNGRIHVLAPVTEPKIPRTTSIEIVR